MAKNFSVRNFHIKSSRFDNILNIELKNEYMSIKLLFEFDCEYNINNMLNTINSDPPWEFNIHYYSISSYKNMVSIDYLPYNSYSECSYIGPEIYLLKSDAIELFNIIKKEMDDYIQL